ncbi:tryptophan--tRNA ligase [Maridesulfovibrio ferrireducens]|uniref:tryptophan--tRNA ligase n=1 Tax=Maridesulfovibrio ferrireducens TaxID=246191 RepID=UPI001A293D73|nr:tryptophan--tRNA ligase [Maridesulfovibrio ferrireducens]MBI9110891.1 tryptophan--tRNA ligase [Maridesulfovibrio ferrireducens]
MSNTKNCIVSGMRPTGRLHLGHYFGVLVNWIKIQEDNECFFFVADWHAMTSEYADPRRIKGFVPELVKDWIAAGLDPEKCTIFHQSQVKEHAELHLILSMLTPVGWLERNPTYKELRQELSQKDLATYGFLGYPVLMASDILMYKPTLVPVGHDQLPHLELTREIARRFNHLNGEFFPEPEAMLTEDAKLPGLDGRKMSKSYNNGIFLGESVDEMRPKVMSMLTDSNRLRKADPGDPEACNLYPYHKLFTDTEKCAEIEEGCRNASLGCVDCKKLLAENMAKFLEPMHERRRKLDENPDIVWQVLAEGTAKARIRAQQNMEIIRERIGFDF